MKYLLMDWKKTNSRVWNLINKGIPPALSTEYYCRTTKREGTTFQTNFHNGKGEPIFRGIAIVDIGNCDEPFCSYEVKED